MASIRMTITPRVCPDIYENIIKLSASQGKKAKKKGKKVSKNNGRDKETLTIVLIFQQKKK